MTHEKRCRHHWCPDTGHDSPRWFGLGGFTASRDGSGFTAAQKIVMFAVDWHFRRGATSGANSGNWHYAAVAGRAYQS